VIHSEDPFPKSRSEREKTGILHVQSLAIKMKGKLEQEFGKNGEGM